MYKINDYVIYKRDVCKILDIKEIKNIKYYVIESEVDKSLKITIPCNKENELLRNIITQKEIDNLINIIPDIKTLDIEARNLEDDYKRLLQDNTIESLITIIKTTYLRNKIRETNKKRAAEKDQYFFDLASRFLYNEIAYSKNISYDEAQNYIIEYLSK